MRKAALSLLLTSAWCLVSAAFDIGSAMGTAEFWKSDPVMFVKRHQAEGFRFTSSDRESADTRLDGAVTYHGIPVFESKVAFTPDGRGVARVELILFSPAGTEVRKMADAHHYRLVRNAKSITRDGFVKLIKDVRAKLTPDGKKSPAQIAERTKKPVVQKFTKFLKDVHDQVKKGVPVFWGVTLGIYPEPEIPQAAGGHMRLIIGYNDVKREILYTDTWGTGHELKRMPVEWAWTITHCLMYLKPLN